MEREATLDLVRLSCSFARSNSAPVNLGRGDPFRGHEGVWVLGEDPPRRAGWREQLLDPA